MYKNNRFGGHGGNNRGFQSHRKPTFGRNRFAGKFIDPRLFVKPAVEEEIVEQKIENNFCDFQLNEQILNNLKNRGFATPTPIQDKTLHKAISGKDLIGLADTGTGKTLAFALPIINKILANPDQNALIMAPTRELAVQIRDEMRSLTENLRVFSALLIGGSNMQRQIMDLRRRPQIFIGTPGRLKDLHERRVLRFDRTYTVVLDEMDRMLDMGFIKDITTLLSYLPKNRQTLLFSATIDERVEGIAKQFMIEPEKISVKTGATAQNVDQNIVKVNGNKMGVLKDLLRNDEYSKVLIFGRTKHGVEKLSLELNKNGYKTDAIHGNKSQFQREKALRLFKNNEIKILIATDVAARGIDVKDISHVINYDQPASYQDYVHRIGRTGRAGKKGFAITFVD